MFGLAVLFSLGAAAFLGAGLIASQYGLRHAPAWRAPVYSVPISALGVALTTPWTIDLAGWNTEAALLFAAVGAVFPVAVSFLTVESNARIGPSLTSALGNVAPVFAVLGAVLFLAESLSWGQAGGLALVVGGVVLMALRGVGVAASWPTWILALPLLSAFVRGAVQPAIKAGLALWPDPWAATLIGYTVSSVVALALTHRRRRAAGPPDRRAVLWFCVQGLLNGTSTFLIYAALGIGSIALVSPLVATYPLFALAFGVAMLKSERPGPRALAGILVSVAGVIVLLLAAG